jgi:ABC-type cobalamin/Fe3+-siderophores transport system ATPase subunit
MVRSSATVDIVDLVARKAEHLTLDLLGSFRVVIVNGPRQSGKSTLLSLLASATGGTAITLDDRQILRVARIALLLGVFRVHSPVGSACANTYGRATCRS